MAATPEARVKKRVKLILEKVGAYYIMPVTSGYGRSGAPDFIVCYKGRFIGIECKAGNNKPTALQLDNLDQIQQSGGTSLLINEDNLFSLESLLC